MTLSTSEILDLIDSKGLPAAVRCIIRVYEAADPDNPWGSFELLSAIPAVHIARWELGHDKNGRARFDPKRVTDPRFMRFVRGHFPRGTTVEDLVIHVGRSCAPRMAQILHNEEVNPDLSDDPSSLSIDEARAAEAAAELRAEMEEILG